MVRDSARSDCRLLTRGEESPNRAGARLEKTGPGCIVFQVLTSCLGNTKARDQT